MRQRLDQLLVDRQLATSREEAQRFVLAGDVMVDDQRADKPGAMFRVDQSIRLRVQRRYVSRGGDKLFGLVEDLGCEKVFRGAKVLDIGSSTGGFTDCALQLGAAHVTCVDIGTHQLAWKLRSDPRVELFEQQDIQTFDEEQRRFDIVMADVSFCRIADLAQRIVALSQKAVGVFLLVKPQFELPAFEVPSGGVVKEASAREKAVALAVSALEEAGMVGVAVVGSRVVGRSGNQEFFIYKVAPMPVD